MPVPLHVGHALAVVLVGRLEIATCPGCQAHECRRAAPVEVVVLGCDVERAAGMLYALDQIAASQRITGTMHGNRSWQSPVFLFVHDDHSRPLSVGLRVSREPPLGVAQALVDALELTA